MASSVLAGLLTVTLFLCFSTIAQGSEPGGYGGAPYGSCWVQPYEIDCVHKTLEIILKIAVQAYVARNPELQSQTPWFDSFKHVEIPKGAFTNTCLRLLSSVDIREAHSYCFEAGGKCNKTYVPLSPVQMYKDLCVEDAKIRQQYY